MKSIRKCFAVFASLMLLATLCQAQFGGLLGGKKNNDSKPVVKSDKPPEYSEKDKAKLAEIAQRPEVQKEIEEAWRQQSMADMTAAYTINMTRNSTSVSLSGSDIDSQLYNNPMLQRYLNEIGQRLVPRNSPNYYAFRIVYNPLPKAWSLTTGSVYISTGLISLLDNEAQLSYVLAHEIAHVEKKHVYNQLRNKILEDALNQDKQASAEKKKMWLGLAGAAAGGIIGGVSGNTGLGLGIGAIGGVVAGQLAFRPKLTETEWSIVEEDEADDQAVKYMLDRGYDVREAPRLYAHLDRIVSKDRRIGIGFIGDPQRIKERVARVNNLLGETYKGAIDAKLKASGLISNSPEFAVIMSAVKRDNAIIALDCDLFETARDNLEDAVALRSSDPLVHFYLGRVVSLTAHTPADQQEALKHISNALKLDEKRGSLPDAHLENAMAMIGQGNPSLKEGIVQELKAYLSLYERDHAGALPVNARYIYDYFGLVGEDAWYLPPQWYPATQLKSASTVVAPERVIRNASEDGYAAPEQGGVRNVSAPARR